MRIKNKELLLTAVFFASVSINCAIAFCQDVSLLSRLTDLETLYNRLILDWPAIRFFILDERTGLDPVMPKIGFSSPILSFGPRRRKGFLREAANPLGYGAGSDVFSEQTEILPDVSLSSPDDSFVQVSPLPGFVSFFTTWKECSLENAGGIFTLPFPDKSYFELLAQASPPTAPSGADAWFTDENLYAGGFVLGCGSRARIDLGPLALHASFLASGNDFYPAGFFTHAGFEAEFGIAAIEGLFGFCSDSYITPEYGFIDKQIQGEARIGVFPSKVFSIWFETGITLDRPPKRPAGYISGAEYCSLVIEGVLHETKDWIADLKANVYYENELCPCGENKKKLKARASIANSFDDFELGIKSNASLSGFSLESAEAGASCILRISRATISIDCEASLFPVFGLSGKMRYEFTTGPAEFFLSVETKKPVIPDASEWNAFSVRPLDFLLITMGFEVKRKQ